MAQGTCATNSCTAVDAVALEAAGYAVATASATDVTGLGAVSCASGYRLADGSTPASAVCAVDGGEFAFAGCELIGEGEPPLANHAKQALLSLSPQWLLAWPRVPLRWLQRRVQRRLQP